MACVGPRPRSLSAIGRAVPRLGLSLALAVSTLAVNVPAARAQDDDSVGLLRDTLIEDFIRQDTDPIFVAAGVNPKAVTVHIIGTTEMNAFVSGGQQMFIYAGLIMKTENPNELIGVMAHETGHMAGGHLVRADEGEKNALKTFLITMGLGLAAALAGRPDAGAGLMYSAGYFATLDYLGYSRVQEADADQAAATFLEKSGQSGKGLVDFFDNFRYEEVFANARRYPYFQNHPLTSDRIEALRVRVEKNPHYSAVDSPEAMDRHRLLVAKLKAFIDPPQQTFVDYKETDKSYVARYARAIAYSKAEDTDRAVKLIDGLIADFPTTPYLYDLYDLKGDVLFEAGRIKESEEPYRKSVALRPDAPLLHISLGQTLVAEEDPAKLDEAIAHLNRSLDFENDDPLTWQILARAYDAKGNGGMARLATAEQEYNLGQLKEARVFALRARELLPKDTPQWRRATDIVLVSQPTGEDLKQMSGQPGFTFTFK
jgi:predicted Zn-dependent protease